MTISVYYVPVIFLAALLIGILLGAKARVHDDVIGTIEISPGSEDARTRYLFKFSEEPDAIPNRKRVAFEVEVQNSQKIQATK